MARRRVSGRATPPLDEALLQLSRALSVYEHKFVTSISVKDVSAMYALKHAEAYEIVNKAHIRMSNIIEKKIQKFKERKEIKAVAVLNDIQKESNRVTELRDEKFKSFTILDSLIGKVFAHKGIKLDANTTVGSSQESIQASRLSAGEKQMLSFVAYNAFAQRAVIFIDEPELSLHADWQRTLLPTLLSQGTENQFLIATHSPFIYSKYPDKEIHIGSKKGAK